MSGHKANGSVRFHLLLGAALALGCTTGTQPRLAAELAAARTLRVAHPASPGSQQLAKSIVEMLDACHADVRLVSSPDADVVIAYEETPNNSCQTYLGIPRECRDSTGPVLEGKATLTMTGGSLQFHTRSEICPTCVAVLTGQKIGRAWCAAAGRRGATASARDERLQAAT